MTHDCKAVAFTREQLRHIHGKDMEKEYQYEQRIVMAQQVVMKNENGALYGYSWYTDAAYLDGLGMDRIK